MNEDSIPQNSDAGEDRVFDISEDNIVPAASTTPAPPAPKIPAIPIPQPPSATTQLPKTEPSNPPVKTVGRADYIKNDFAPAAPSPAPSSGLTDPNLRPLRTYESDVADVMSHRKTSAASIAIAESQREGGGETISDAEPQGSGRSPVSKLIVVLASLVLIGGGVIGGYYLYSVSPLAPSASVAPVAQAPASIVPADTSVSIPIDGLSPTQIVSQIRIEASKSQDPSTIKEIVPVETQNGSYAAVGATDMINLMQLSPPDILVRSLTPEWMLGIYADPSGQKSAFVIVTSNFFQDSFAGMLQWENDMPDDLKQFLYTAPPMGVATISTSTAPAAATSTASILAQLDDIGSILPLASTTSSSGTSTPAKGKSAASSSPTANKTGTGGAASTTVSTTTSSVAASETVQPYFTVSGQFEDRIIQNKDVREFVTTGGTVLFLYSFIDNTHLVISGSESALMEILDRLENQAFVR